MEEISPVNNFSMEAGNVSFESINCELDFDQLCLKNHVSPLHFAIQQQLEDFVMKNGGISLDAINKSLKSKSTLAINVGVWKEKRKRAGVLVIAQGIVLVVSKDDRKQL